MLRSSAVPREVAVLKAAAFQRLWSNLYRRTHFRDNPSTCLKRTLRPPHLAAAFIKSRCNYILRRTLLCSVIPECARIKRNACLKANETAYAGVLNYTRRHERTRTTHGFQWFRYLVSHTVRPWSFFSRRGRTCRLPSFDRGSISIRRISSTTRVWIEKVWRNEDEKETKTRGKREEIETKRWLNKRDETETKRKREEDENEMEKKRR